MDVIIGFGCTNAQRVQCDRACVVVIRSAFQVPLLFCDAQPRARKPWISQQFAESKVLHRMACPLHVHVFDEVLLHA